ncbi:unnamed protein product [Closterium sp. NIES-53]
MGEQELATDYCNRARRILAEMRMAGAEYSTVSYITHVLKGLPRSYNLMKRTTMVPNTRESLDEDSLTSYILQDEAMQEAEQPTELLPLASYATPTKQNRHQEQRAKPGRGGSGWGRSTKDVDEKRSTRDKGRGGGGRWWECWISHDPDHLSYECPDRDDNNEDDTKGGRGRSTSSRPRRDATPRKEKQTSSTTWSTKDVDNSSGKSRGDGEASCLMVGVVEPTVSLAPEAGKEFQAMAAALKESRVQLQGDGDEMLLVAATGEVLGRARYNGRVLCTNLRPCLTRSPLTEVVALRTILSATKLTPDQLDARLAHVGVDTIKSSAKHEVGTGLNIKPSIRADPLCVSCVGGKLARHTFPDKGSDAKVALAVVHIDLCGPFRVAAKDGSLYFMFREDDAAAHSHAAPLVAPRSTTSCLGAQLLGAVDDAAGDDFVPAADQEEARPHAGAGVGLHGAVHGLGGTRSDQQQGGHVGRGDLLRDAVAGGVEGKVWASVRADVGTPSDGHLDGNARRPPERPSFHACLPPAAFTTLYDEVDDDLLYEDAEEDEELPELDPDVHADPEHHWDIATMTVKEGMTSWKGEAVKAAMEEEIHNLIDMGTWELVERPRGVNVMKNRWVLTTKYRIDNTVEREKARLLDKKNAFLQSKIDRVLYMYQPDYFDDGTGRVCKLLKSLYRLKQLSLLWYSALNSVVLGAGWKKSQVDEALYFKAGDNRVSCWVLVYVDDLLAASSSPAMLKELKELLEAAFEVREISPVVKYLGLEIVRFRPARNLWLHQQGYVDKLRRRFIDEEQGGRVPKTSVSVDAYAELTFNDEEAQEREEEEYQQKVGSLQFAATTTRLDIAFACSKLGSSLTVRSDQHWREVDRCLAYLADTRDTALEFGGGPDSLELIGYMDADDAGNKQNRTSTRGYVFVYGGATVS